ncbi:MAG: sigma-54 dependent transcriptional regulator [Pyrinomonadaceae bacterium]
MEPIRVLIIDFSHDELSEELLAIFEEKKDFRCEFLKLKGTAGNRDCFKKKLSRGIFDLFLLKLTPKDSVRAEKLIGSPGFAEFRQPSIICTGDFDSGKLLNFLNLGIDDFVIAPLNPEDLFCRIRRLTRKVTLTPKLLAKTRERIGLGKIIGKNPGFTAEIAKLPVIAGCDACVLITGETGTGKEIIARAIHYLSPRSGKPFVPVNCGAIPNDLVENELFGHERGAFTGAMISQKGLISEAEGGTVFLDEVDSLPLISQVKLLRFLQDKEYRSLGSVKTRKGDVRVIAASNHDLEDLLRAEKIRSDLYYRLNVMRVALPPLRDRPEDIILLAGHFLKKYTAEFGRDFRSIEPEGLLKLQNHDWRGNIRELENVIERAVLLGEKPLIRAGDLLIGDGREEKSDQSFRAAKARVIESFEQNYLIKILETYRGNISRAARAAGKNRRAFFQLIRKYRINVEQFKT